MRRDESADDEHGFKALDTCTKRLMGSGLGLGRGTGDLA